MAQQTINVGASANDNTGDGIRDGGIKINDNFTELYSILGWIQYSDDEYTSGSPQSVLSGNTATLQNNGATVLNTYKPTSVTDLYDDTTQRMTPENIGDGYSMSIRFKLKTTNNNDYINLRLNIGSGSDIIILQESIRLVKGANTEQFINVNFDFYTLDTFVTNGGLIEIEAVNGNLSIYETNYVIKRTSKAV